MIHYNGAAAKSMMEIEEVKAKPLGTHDHTLNIPPIHIMQHMNTNKGGSGTKTSDIRISSTETSKERQRRMNMQHKDTDEGSSGAKTSDIRTSSTKISKERQR